MIVKIDPKVTDEEVYAFEFELIKNTCIHHAENLAEFMTTQAQMGVMDMSEGKEYAMAVGRLCRMIQSYIGCTMDKYSIALLKEYKNDVHYKLMVLFDALEKKTNNDGYGG